MTRRRSSPIAIGILIAVPLLLGLSLLLFLPRGTADRKDGVPLVARVERAGVGSCIFGATGERCYRLSLEVQPEEGAVFRKQLDVLIPERHTARVQPGAHVWVVQNRLDPKDVLLAVEAFEEAPPPPTVGRSK